MRIGGEALGLVHPLQSLFEIICYLPMSPYGCTLEMETGCSEKAEEDAR